MPAMIRYHVFWRRLVDPDDTVEERKSPLFFESGKRWIVLSRNFVERPTGGVVGCKKVEEIVFWTVFEKIDLRNDGYCS
ncbi:hypothetical protein TNCV_789061 [Trichonephila clavipes]|nr:hypothetical protein TNCV_789061 [Trichonephila clavipes]